MPETNMSTMAPLHTHDNSGIIHVESIVNRNYKLEEFLNIWGLNLDLCDILEVSREALNSNLEKFYANFAHGAEWSDNVVNTMRAGMIGRLQEMGLVERHKSGKFVSYNITKQGISVVNSLIKGGSNRA